MSTMPFLLVERPSRSRTAVSAAAPATAAISTGRKASDSGSIAHEMIATAGMRNTATWAPDARAISAASLMFPRRAITIAPPCSAALPTIATMTAATKNSLNPAASANTSSDPTRISATSAVTSVATPSTSSEARSDQPANAASSDVWSSWCRRNERHVTAT